MLLRYDLLSLSLILLHYVTFFCHWLCPAKFSCYTCLTLTSCCSSLFIHQKGSTQAAILQGFHIIPQLWQGLKAQISFHSALTASRRLFQRVPATLSVRGIHVKPSCKDESSLWSHQANTMCMAISVTLQITSSSLSV